MRYIVSGLIFVVAFLSACTADPSRYVEKKKYDELQAKLDEAEKRLAEYDSHRYSLFSTGSRTFRVDSVTGSTCIKLTTNSDWKRKDVQGQSCDCVDYLANTKATHSPELTALFCGTP